jgi:hypothetical protein
MPEDACLFFVRLPRLRATAEAQARGLLRVLFLRLGALPAGASGTAPRLSTVQGQCFAMFEVLNIV